jgi:hypothetical protein
MLSPHKQLKGPAAFKGIADKRQRTVQEIVALGGGLPCQRLFNERRPWYAQGCLRPSDRDGLRYDASMVQRIEHSAHRQDGVGLVLAAVKPGRRLPFMQSSFVATCAKPFMASRVI